MIVASLLVIACALAGDALAPNPCISFHIGKQNGQIITLAPIVQTNPPPYWFETIPYVPQCHNHRGTQASICHQGTETIATFINPNSIYIQSKIISYPATVKIIFTLFCDSVDAPWNNEIKSWPSWISGEPGNVPPGTEASLPSESIVVQPGNWNGGSTSCSEGWIDSSLNSLKPVVSSTKADLPRETEVKLLPNKWTTGWTDGYWKAIFVGDTPPKTVTSQADDLPRQTEVKLLPAKWTTGWTDGYWKAILLGDTPPKTGVINDWNAGVTDDWNAGVTGDWNAGVTGDWNAGVTGDWNAGVTGDWNAGVTGDWNAGVTGDWNAGVTGDWNAGVTGDWTAGVTGNWNAGLPSARKSGLVGDWNTDLVGDWQAGVTSDWKPGLVGDLKTGLGSDWKTGLSSDWGTGLVGSWNAAVPSDWKAGLSGDWNSGPGGNWNAGLPGNL